MSKTETPVRLLILSAGNPELDRPFSGSLRSLVQALERQGVVHAKANVLGYSEGWVPGPWWIRLLRRLDKVHGFDRYYFSRLCFHRNTKRALRAAAVHPGFNACLMYGTSFHPALDVPTYCYMDGTAAQIERAGGWQFKFLSKQRRREVVDYQRRVFEHCAGIFPRTQYAAESVIQDYGIAPENVIPAGAGPNYFVDPHPHGPYDTKTILFIGKDFERKGGPLILDAFRLLRKRMPEARLVIVGCEPPVDEPGVAVVGLVHKDAPGGLDRLLKLYSEASLFSIMSSFEPFGIVVVEAQHCRVPCVVPDRFAFPEMVADGKTGRVVPEDDPKMLAAIYEELLSNPARLAAMGQAGHEHVHANFTWDVAAQRIVDRISADLQHLG